MLEFERTYTISKKVNLTSLIDVVFQLVLFFMLTTSFVQSGNMALDFAPVNVSVSDKPGDDKSIFVRIKDNKRIEMNNKPYTFQEFPLKLVRLMSDSPDYSVVVAAERPVSVQALVTVMDLATKAGAKNITLAE